MGDDLDDSTSTLRCAATWAALVVSVAIMVRRRTEYDVLQSTGESRWFVVRAVHGRILKSRLLPPGTHLQREFVASIIAYIDEGWTIGDFSSRSAFYVATKRADRIEVMISASDPYLPLQS